jgi:hypothetical protein
MNVETLVRFIAHNITNKSWIYWPPGPMVGQVFDTERCRKDCKDFLERNVGISLRYLQELNQVRARRWHGTEPDAQWTTLEWGGAMAGEVGEACNAAKKIRRIDSQMKHKDQRLFGQAISLPEQREKYRQQVGKEIADAIIYGVLMAAKEGLNIEDCVRDVFNTKSEEYGFPERL